MSWQASHIELDLKEPASEWLMHLLFGCEVFAGGRDEQRLQVITAECTTRDE